MTLRKALLLSPEYILIGLTLFYWWSTALIWNPVAIGLIALLTTQLFIKNRAIGIALSVILILLSFYMLLALFSEFKEFETVNSEARKLLTVGLALILGTMGMSTIMLYRYGRDPQKLPVNLQAQRSIGATKSSELT